MLYATGMTAKQRELYEAEVRYVAARRCGDAAGAARHYRVLLGRGTPTPTRPKSALARQMEALSLECRAVASVIDRECIRGTLADLSGGSARRAAGPACDSCGEPLDAFGCSYCD